MQRENKKQSHLAHGATARGGISEIFIRRPITTTLLMAGIVLFGLIGYRALPVSDLPTVDYPTISVNASLPGANPETKEHNAGHHQRRRDRTANKDYRDPTARCCAVR